MSAIANEKVLAGIKVLQLLLTFLHLHFNLCKTFSFHFTGSIALHMHFQVTLCATFEQETAANITTRVIFTSPTEELIPCTAFTKELKCKLNYAS